MNAIVLIGFMGAGKTTVGKKLATALHRSYIDMDDILTKQLGQSIATFFEKNGEESFRLHEKQLLEETVQRPVVLATGGGVVLREENQRILANGTVIYLKTSPEILVERIRNDRANIRPNAQKKNDQEIQQLFFSREKLYEKLAKIIIDTTDKIPDELVTEIIKRIEEK